MMVPRITVVIPTYRRQDLLPRAIASVLAAASASGICGRVEVVVVDDEASDETRRAVEQADVGATRLRYCRHPAGPHRGPAACRNYGVRTSTGEFIYWLDDDDEFLANRFARSLPLLEGGIHDLVLERVIRRRDGETVSTAVETGPVADIRMPAFRYLLTGGPASHVAPAATAFTRRIFDAVGGQDERLRYGEDGEFMLRLCLNGRVALLAGPPVACYHQHRTNASCSDRLHYWQNIASFGILYRKLRKGRYVDAEWFLGRVLSGKLDYVLDRYRRDARGLGYRYAGGCQALWHFPIGCLTWNNLKSIAVWLLWPSPSASDTE